MRMREYAVHADYAHICEYADADENLIHIIHIYIYAKNGHVLGQKLFSILNAQNIFLQMWMLEYAKSGPGGANDHILLVINIAHPFWFYSSTVVHNLFQPK